MKQAFNVRDILGAGNPVDRLGRPLHDLRISVMDRCNFRCPYCMPKEQFHEHYRFLKSQERLSFDEIVRLARLFASLGVRKLRLTGGEPLLRANLADLIGDLTGIPGNRRHRPHHQWRAARAARGRLARQRLEAGHGEPGHSRQGDLRAHERRLRRARPGIARHRCRDRRRAFAGEDQRGHRARHQRSRSARSPRKVSRHARDRAIHRVHGCGQPQ